MIDTKKLTDALCELTYLDLKGANATTAYDLRDKIAEVVAAIQKGGFDLQSTRKRQASSGTRASAIRRGRQKGR